MTVLNMLGLSADTLGNHNFDRGSAYLRTTLIPIAKFPYLSANTVFKSNGKLPSIWKASWTFNSAASSSASSATRCPSSPR